jgi:hypothetical protein
MYGSSLHLAAFLLGTVALTLGSPGCADKTSPNIAQPQPAAPATRPGSEWGAPVGKEVLRLKAEGVQIYSAEADGNGKLAWNLKAPDAILRDEKGEKAATHYAGPTWEGVDGSKVVGAKVAQRSSPNADAVPELQLKASSHAGAGIMASVVFVERINTKGGKAPDITSAVKPGDEVRVPYTAEYVFYAVNP